MAGVSYVKVNGKRYAFKDTEARTALGSMEQKVDFLLGAVADAIVARGGRRPADLGDFPAAIAGIPDNGDE